jgi:hypothetical protein
MNRLDQQERDKLRGIYISYHILIEVWMVFPTILTGLWGAVEHEGMALWLAALLFLIVLVAYGLRLWGVRGQAYYGWYDHRVLYDIFHGKRRSEGK